MTPESQAGEPPGAPALPPGLALNGFDAVLLAKQVSGGQQGA